MIHIHDTMGSSLEVRVHVDIFNGSAMEVSSKGYISDVLFERQIAVLTHICCHHVPVIVNLRVGMLQLCGANSVHIYG